MSSQATTPPPGNTAGSATPPSLPDVNVETYPFHQVQSALDKSVWINTYASPFPRHYEKATLTPGNPGDFFGFNTGYGLDLRSSLHRYESSHSATSSSTDIGPTQEAIGEGVGELRARCLFTTGEPAWAPGQEPPPAIFDPWKSQYFTLVDGSISMGGDRGKFTLYGGGMTFPQTVNGKPETAVCAVANTTSGSGEFSQSEGTVVLMGTLTPDWEFCGHTCIRIPDPGSGFTPKAPVPPISHNPGLKAHDEGIYITMRGEKRDSSVRTEYGEPPGEGLVSLVTPAMMRAVTHSCCSHSGGGIRVEMHRGNAVAHLEAFVTLDILAPPGTAQNPNFFITRNVYSFIDSSGATVGRVIAQVVYGKSFATTFPELPNQPGMRYGGIGPVVETDGIFSGMSGTVAVNSAIGIAPHALSMLNVLRLV